MLDVARPGPDYTLRWPRELFAQEGRALLAAQPVVMKKQWTGQVESLLEEAFITTMPVTDFRQSDQRSTWTDGEAVGLVKAAPYLRQPGLFLSALLDISDRLPEESSPRPYWTARHGQRRDDDIGRPDPGAVRRDWVAAVGALQRRGYLVQVAPEPCVDDRDADPTRSLDDAIAERLGRRGLWNVVKGEDWDDTTFYSLIEVMHDLVRRPRTRWYHDYNQCGWHYDDFAAYPAQVLYRWTVNRILTRHGVGLALAKSGEDVGRLVRQPADPRGALMESVAANTAPELVGTVDHAVALFRARDANRDEKRSACVALAGVLERRRNLVKLELLAKDERALFQIANDFDLRHRKPEQRADYDDVFLDWLFWWYLATVELTNHLLARQTAVGT
jgi:hypothetical protein